MFGDESDPVISDEEDPFPPSTAAGGTDDAEEVIGAIAIPITNSGRSEGGMSFSVRTRISSSYHHHDVIGESRSPGESGSRRRAVRFHSSTTNAGDDLERMECPPEQTAATAAELLSTTAPVANYKRFII